MTLSEKFTLTNQYMKKKVQFKDNGKSFFFLILVCYSELLMKYSP